VAGSGIAFGNVMLSISGDSSYQRFTFVDVFTGLGNFVVVSCALVKGFQYLRVNECLQMVTRGFWSFYHASTFGQQCWKNTALPVS
jgi:hypothetical protein